MKIEKHDDVFVLTMDQGENRWNTAFTRAFAEALDEVEASSGGKKGDSNYLLRF